MELSKSEKEQDGAGRKEGLQMGRRAIEDKPLRVEQQRYMKELQDFEDELSKKESMHEERMVWWRRAWWIRVGDGPDLDTTNKRRHEMRAVPRA